MKNVAGRGKPKPYSIHRPVGEWLYGTQPVKAALDARKRAKFFDLYVRDSHFDTRQPHVLDIMKSWRKFTGKEAKLVSKEFLGNILQDKLHQVS